jgi:predicted Fe-Mo cluster-binding NifX family protein
MSATMFSPARTAVVVMNTGSKSVLCPFFNKCDGVLLINAAGDSKDFHLHDCYGEKSLCELIIDLKPERVICGFIDQPEKQCLRAAGFDVRLGSCSCSIDELVASYSSLPKA